MNSTLLLIDPKFPHNVGGTLRAASCFGAGEIVFTGNRVADEIMAKGRIPREERLRGYRDVSLVHSEHPFDYLKGRGTPVAVELRENAECLMDFEHPEDAIYVFGPEDGSLGRNVLTHCHRFVVIPTRYCTNLSAAVYLMLYDRALKTYQRTGVKPTTGWDYRLMEERVSDDDNKSLFVQAMERRLAAAR